VEGLIKIYISKISFNLSPERREMLYITFNDYPGGIFESQVIDVIQYLNKLSHQKIRLISFVSMRNFFSNRKKIKPLYPYSIVIPMFPGIHNLQMYASFRKHNCGIIVSNSSIKEDLNKIDESEKKRIHQLAIQYFTKEKYENEYRKVLNSNK
jgi:hypothetical protein